MRVPVPHPSKQLVWAPLILNLGMVILPVEATAIDLWTEEETRRCLAECDAVRVKSEHRCRRKVIDEHYCRMVPGEGLSSDFCSQVWLECQGHTWDYHKACNRRCE